MLTRRKYLYFLFFIATLHLQQYAFAQAELAPWGNITGVRIEGQLFPFETKLTLMQKDGSRISTGKELQRPIYKRMDDFQEVTTELKGINIVERLKSDNRGTNTVSITAIAKSALKADGLFWAIKIPDNATVNINGKLVSDLETFFSTIPVRQISYKTNQQEAIINFENGAVLHAGKHELLISIHTGDFEGNDSVSSRFTFGVTGKVDTSPVELNVSQASKGNVFDGFGGNFRLQNSKTDPQVIQYCLENMRVAWGRVEMPWRFWQPAITDQPLRKTKEELHPSVKAAMEMAQTLHEKGMPIVLSAWSAPAWAVIGEPKFSPGPDGVWGNPLNNEHTSEIYKSIADYVEYLKKEYNVTVDYFSFNESDLGINIRQTAAEHAALIKGLGAYFEKRGLKTKLLLGDNSDATTYSFINAAINDPATHPYIGAVSFHSWRGWEQSTLEKWAAAAKKISKPLIVGEGSIDAQAWGYPAIFEEPTYALEEINLYIRLLNICKPASILQWQLTADYSPLAGGGVFGDQRPLQPTQRFWNLKQLASTPAGLRALAATSSKSAVTIAALANENKVVVHLVNNGATRKAVLKGLPANTKSLKVLVTSQGKHMEELTSIPVRNGKVELSLAARTFTTLISP
ncbi:hypothetical protein DVR12_19280 [Chitinophaga silvatica]|uniref:O-Glycosyl hydrolase n=1 Tax=Chitinophaga silvatica TaxID=2282649 RepID=A0A3E1Y6Y7_9BACT|nr:hypothetical protein [Chitinophaga silvatica]RFS20702.1 hypothetical protein DVR12_19280 [Chitinophaga silvatica]